jgi:hypothetical protein
MVSLLPTVTAASLSLLYPVMEAKQFISNTALLGYIRILKDNKEKW